MGIVMLLSTLAMGLMMGFVAYIATLLEAMVTFINVIILGLNAVKVLISPGSAQIPSVNNPRRMDAGSDFAKAADSLGIAGAEPS
jgi:hypothetical protein